MNFEEWCDASLELWWLGREATPQERAIAEAAWNAAIGSTKTAPSQEPFGYWFQRERRFATLDESERYFDADEREELLAPLYTHPSNAAAQIANLTKQRDDLLAALEKLARLGNGDQYGNSDGNMIARAAIAKVKQ